MNGPRIFIFPDTNLFFQCREPGELDWSELGDFEEIELIVTRPVQKEIDRRKGEGNTRLGRRARKAHALIRSVTANNLEPLVLREKAPRISLSLRIGLKPDAALSNVLDYEEADDALVGIAGGFAARSPELQVAVLTQDGGVMASSVAAGVPHFAIPDSWALPPEENKELKAAQTEIARLRKAEPRFDVMCVDGDGQKLDRIILENPHIEPLVVSEVETLMDLVRRKFPKQVDFTPPPAAAKPQSTGYAIRLESLKGLHMPPSEQQIAAYHRGYQKWEEQFRERLGNVHQWLYAKTAKLTVSFRAENTGTRPADDALIEFKAHGDFFISRPPRDDDDRTSCKKRLPRPPAVPVRSSFSSALTTSMSLLGATHERSFNIPVAPYIQKPRDPEGFYYKTDAVGSVLRLSCQLWRHGRDAEDFDVLVEPYSLNEAAGALEFSIHAGNLTDAITLTVPLEIKTIRPSAFEYAAELIEQLREKGVDE